MKVLVLTTVFPNCKQPALGTFVRERMFRVAKECELKVVAPVPWFPFAGYLKPNYRPMVPRKEIQQGIEVYHPRFFSIPGVLKCLDGIFFFLSLLSPLRRIRNNFDFDIIDAHFSYPEGLGAVLLARFFNRPVTITLRGTIVPLSKYLLRRVQIIYALRNATKVFSVSNSLKEKAVSLGIESSKILPIPNGVDMEKFFPVPKDEARQELDLLLDKKIIISVGGLVKRKGFHRVLAVLPEVTEKYKEILYVIVGGPTVEGDLGPELKKQVKELNLDGHVHFTGPLPHDQVRKWLNAADIFCLATSNEGWANVFFEAMACGKPVVTTKVGGNEEVVKSANYGILVDLDDQKQLKDAIIEALEKKWDHRKIIEYASENNWENVARKVLQELNDIVAIFSQ
uniref:D-inositol-3-phosphate glycosyltransferase n=1 Tax=Candidatus Methanogaster sp. ANME-2c ERB4 TaxID=2759911 RepID=A0A7G9YB78_9EURY|nr:D-inositol-3-phosphate glycosyltransferase [Methanosarcinales archaeon ANME-2c ERB4]QNO46819.1 D-inositol-3-phosphate glycosyltransferase [Methanosarcinales archaeon ANME-2c ERB4]